MRVPELIKKVASGEKTHKDLSEDEARWILGETLAGRLTDLQAGALLAALRLKGESVDELAGFLQAVRETTLPAPRVAGPVVAHCGVTGGKGHFFLSAPAAAVLAAAAGIKIIICGRTGEEARGPLTDVDVFKALGLNTLLPPSAAAGRLEQYGLAVVEQRLYHPALTRLSAFREPLGMRTVAQSVEKFVFPVAPTAAVAGAFHLNYLRQLAEAAARVYGFRLYLLQERDGSTDPMPINPAKGFVVADGQVSDWQMTAEEAGLERQPQGSLPAVDLAETVALTRVILSGRQTGPRREMVLYNAGLLIHAGRPEVPLREAVARARTLLDDGAGAEALHRLTSGR